MEAWARPSRCQGSRGEWRDPFGARQHLDLAYPRDPIRFNLKTSTNVEKRSDYISGRGPSGTLPVEAHSWSFATVLG